jgi:hypothetical protein
MLGVYEATIWRRIKSGDIQSSKVGNHRFITADELQRLLSAGGQ